MNKGKIILTIVIAAFIAAAALFYFSNRTSKLKNERALHEIFGSIEATEVDVNVKVPGKVADIAVEEGDFVREGERIATFEAENIKAKVKQAEAVYEAAVSKNRQAKVAYDAQAKQSEAVVKQAESALNAAKSQLKKVKGGARPQQLAQAGLLVEQAKNGYEYAKISYERLEQLAKENLVAQQKIDGAKTEMEVAKAKYETAVEQYNLVKEGAQQEDIDSASAVVGQAQAALAVANAAKLQIDLRKQDIEASKAQMEQAKGAVEEAKSYLNDSTVTAPVSGVVSMRSVDKGELVSTGMPIVTITNLKEIWLNIKVSENEISQFNYGEFVNVKISGLKGKIYKGKVTYIAAKPSYAVEKATPEKGSVDIVYFGVKIKLINEDLKLKPGMTGSIIIERE